LFLAFPFVQSENAKSFLSLALPLSFFASDSRQFVTNSHRYDELELSN
jgi:hypothetical protein